jgi:hypothetical protein
VCELLWLSNGSCWRRQPIHLILNPLSAGRANESPLYCRQIAPLLLGGEGQGGKEGARGTKRKRASWTHVGINE